MLHQQITGAEPAFEQRTPETKGVPFSPKIEDPYRVYASDTDRQLAEKWLRDQIGQPLELVEDKDFVTARRFVAEDGREVIVYTHLPAEGDEDKVIY